MNIFEKKLYNLINILSEEEDVVVKNKETGNVYKVKRFNPEKHDKPTPQEIEKTKAANGGQIPAGGESEEGDKEQAKQKAMAPEKPQPEAPKKIAAADFKTSAEKNGKKNEKCIEWYDNGYKWVEYTYKDDKNDGKYELWNKLARENNIKTLNNLPEGLIKLECYGNPLEYNFEPTLENIRNYLASME